MLFIVRRTVSKLCGECNRKSKRLGISASAVQTVDIRLIVERDFTSLEVAQQHRSSFILKTHTLVTGVSSNMKREI